MSKKRLVLIDGNAILHRAYFALPPLTTRGGQPVNAVYGFTTMLLKVIADLAPTHLAVAFDTEKPTFRQEMFIGYQAQRPRMEADLSSQIEIVQDLVRAFGIPIYAVPGYEADDVIGTIAQKAKKEMEVIIVSGDRDLLQLVGPKTKVYAPIKGISLARLFGPKDVREYMGVKPSQIVEYKGLVGDPSDNYPGVSGIGPKTASKLLAQFGTIEVIYKNLAKIEKKLAEKLAEGKKSALLSRRLAQIVTDVPLKAEISEMKFKGVGDRDEVVEKLKELGFKSLVARIKGEEEKSSRGRSASGRKSGNGQMELI